MELEASRPWQRHQYHVWGPQAGKKFLLYISQLPLILSAVAMTAMCSGFNGSDFVNIKLSRGRNISPTVQQVSIYHRWKCSTSGSQLHPSLCFLIRTKEEQMKWNSQRIHDVSQLRHNQSTSQQCSGSFPTHWHDRAEGFLFYNSMHLWLLVELLCHMHICHFLYLK